MPIAKKKRKQHRAESGWMWVLNLIVKNFIKNKPTFCHFIAQHILIPFISP